MKTTKKALLLTCCALILVAATVMGTMAYLTAADDVKNTFAAAELLDGEFVLTEHEVLRDAATGKQTLGDATTPTNSYTIVPGASLPKDPFAEFTLAETAYLFVAVDDKLPEGMTFKMDDNWKALDDGHGHQVEINEMPVWVYGTAALEAKSQAYNINIIKDKKVDVAGSIDLEPGEDGQAVTGTLNFYGYLVQGQTFDTPLAAWTAWQATVTP